MSGGSLRRRRTRIVCTVGPGSNSDEVLSRLLEAGMDVARLNFSHGTHEIHRDAFARIRRLSEARGRHVAVLQDLCGPKIRVGPVREGTVLEAGREVVLTAEEVEGGPERVHVSYSRLAAEVDPGDVILLDDGHLELQVVQARPPAEVVARVVLGGALGSHKGVNLPGCRLSLPALTEKDEEDLRFGLELGVDVVALSFVRRPEDVLRVREVMDEVGVRRPVFAKLEKPEAVSRLEEIVEAFDGVMVARGDLGIEMPVESVPVTQKRVIALCRAARRPVITATQMLDSMIRNPRPTRAEVTDIANAILDGTDAVMLSGETATGRYPVEAVRVMDRVAAAAEELLPYGDVHTASAPAGQSVEAMALAACEVAEVVGARAIVACTSTGRTVRCVAHHRPRAPILGLAHDPTVARQLSLIWGVVPISVPYLESAEDLMAGAERITREMGLAGSGDRVVLAAGLPLGSPTNLVYLATLD